MTMPQTSHHHFRCPGRAPAPLSRRQLLQASGTGFGMVAFSALSEERGFGATSSQAHFPGPAKNVIFLFMDGGVSHVDTFDPKPALAAHEGEPWSGDANRKWVKSPWKFAQHGDSGMWISELFPHIASCADDIAVIRSMKADLPIHATGVLLLHTGNNRAGGPSFGSWVSYGLGNESENLPGYVVLSFGHVPVGGLEAFGSGFLPASYEATTLKADGAPLDNLLPAGSLDLQRAKLKLLRQQDSDFSASLGRNDTVESAIRNYELAARMQTLVPDVLDESQETKSTLELYGLDDPDQNTRLYARQCLRARRLIESGVRFVQINCPYGLSNGTWDQHGGLKAGHEKNARQTDRASPCMIICSADVFWSQFRGVGRIDKILLASFGNSEEDLVQIESCRFLELQAVGDLYNRIRSSVSGSRKVVLGSSRMLYASRLRQNISGSPH